MAIGTKIKKIRELRNLTQEYMAQELNMSQQNYSRLEADSSELSYKRLEQIADILKVKLEDITNFDDAVVFNNFNNEVKNQIGYSSGLGEEIRMLYEEQLKAKDKIIALLEDKIRNFEK
jgi:transcriptional regulator with XRE-family HTH domain